MVNDVFLLVEGTKYVQTMQNQFLISLFLRGKIRGKLSTFLRCAVLYMRIILLLTP